MKQRRLGLTVIILSAAALSVLAIACRTTTDGLEARTVELRQVQRVATAFNNVIDSAIARRSGFADDEISICPPQSTAFRTIFATRVVHIPHGARATMDDIPVDRTVVELQELQALFNLKVDEAFVSRDSAAYRELLSVKVGSDGLTGTVTAPKGNVAITEAR